MRPRNLAILSLIVVALAAYIFLYERHQRTTDEQRERADKVFPELELDRVAALEIRNSHGSFRLAEADGEWRLTDPIDYPASAAAVNGLIRSIENLDAERTLSVDEVGLDAYGLEDPGLEVALVADDGTRFELAVGDEAALGSNRAMRRDDEPAILLGSGWFVTDLDKALDDWRSREVADVVADELASIEVVAGDGRVRADRTGNLWTLSEPIPDLADSDHIRNLVADLNALRVEEFLDSRAETAALGLDEPAYDVTLQPAEGDPPVRLSFGATREQDGTTQVACRRGDDMFWVSDRALSRLDRAPVRWRATRVFQFDTWDADGLTISAGESVTLARQEGIWQASDGSEVDHSAVQRRLSALAELEAAEFDLISPATDVLGEVRLTLAADGDDGAPTVVGYTFHRPLTEGGQAMVAVTARDTVMSVELDAAEEILADPLELLEAEEASEGGSGE
jgi:hypothetical protein